MDPSFGRGGLITANLSNGVDSVRALAVQPDGAVVMAGVVNETYSPAGSDAFIVRLTAAGAVDASFGNAGAVVIDVNGGVDAANALVRQPDGKIIMAGQLDGRPAVIRLTVAGTFDSSFAGGVVVLPGEGSARALALADDGGVVVVGTGTAVARLLSDGSFDPAFGIGGVVVSTGSSPQSPTAVVVDRDGKVVVGGTTYPSPVFSGYPGYWVLARYTSSGVLDPTFGDGGAVETNFDTTHVDRSNYLAALAVQRDGRVVAVGGASVPTVVVGPPGPGNPVPLAVRHVAGGDIAVARYLADGSLDPSFAGSGKVITRVPGQAQSGPLNPGAVVTAESESRAWAVALDGAGRLLVAGSSRQGEGRATVVRYTTSGLLDTTFGRGGVFTVTTAGRWGSASALALHADGRIIIGGDASPGLSSDSSLLLARAVPGTSAGAVAAWGWNGVGQVGDGTTADRHEAVPVPGLTGVVAVSAGGYHTLALRADGTVWAWGWNGVGQLGDGTTTDRLQPVQVQALSGVVAIAAGGLHSLALRGDGTVWAWGWNVAGELGDGTTTTRLTPVAIPSLADVVAISAGMYHSAAIRDEGVAFAWGWNGTGQLGDGTMTDRLEPVALPGQPAPSYAIVAVSAGGLHTMALDAVTEPLAWGWNGSGQIAWPPGQVLPPGHYTASPFIVGVAAGAHHSLALRPDGLVVSAGFNSSGQLGDGTTATHSWAGPVPGLTGVGSIAAGGFHSAAVTQDRHLFEWGWNGMGQLGNGSTVDAASPRPVALSNVVAVSAGLAHTVALMA
ncbi:MAG: hypothetical protein ACRD12_16305 [Acidimicrobiales bacterium]